MTTPTATLTPSGPDYRISATAAAALLGVSRKRIVELYTAGRLNGRYETDSRVLWINRDEKFEAIRQGGARP